MRTMKPGFLLIILSFVLSNAFGQNPKLEKVDGLFKEWQKPSEPGGAVAIVKDGQLIYSKAFGIGDLEHNIPITPHSVFYIASVSKQFVAFSILLLEEEGKLSLEDEVQKYFPDFPRYEKPIRIKHLIHHTSGLRDFSTLWDLQGKNYLEDISEGEVYKLICRQKALNFLPEEEYMYSNTGYFLLGKIVEKASNQKLKDFARENIFTPLGMKDTVFLDDNRQLIKNRVFSYEKAADSGTFYNVIRRYDLVGSGGIYSSVEDLSLWDKNFNNNKLGKGGQDIINKMHQEGVITKGPRSGYAFGISNSTYKGLKRVSHNGSNASFRAQVTRFPDQKVSIIVLANRSDVNISAKSNEVADVMLEEELARVSANKQLIKTDQEVKKSSDASITAKELNKYAGNYINTRNYTLARVYVENNTLKFVQPTSVTTLLPVNDREFRVSGNNQSQTIYQFDIKKDAMTISISEAGSVRLTYQGYGVKEYSPESLKVLEGVYFSPELNSSYEIKAQGKDLKFAVNGGDYLPVRIISENMLYNDDFGLFKFERDNKNKVTGFKLSVSRIKNLQFLKQ
jgi:CubicO group peptidase (beta-lactamase class C family)